MGYDLHITRRKDWSDDGRDISAEEWLAYVRRDPELRLQLENGPCFVVWDVPSGTEEHWLDWFRGQIYSKYPDEALVEKMLAIAGEFDASVQGDDGEIYDRGGKTRLPRSLCFDADSPASSAVSSEQSSEMDHPPLPFRVGDRVRDLFGNEHTVIDIDPKAMDGWGIIRTRRDDGIEIGHVISGHELSPIPDQDREKR